MAGPFVAMATDEVVDRRIGRDMGSCVMAMTVLAVVLQEFRRTASFMAVFIGKNRQACAIAVDGRMGRLPVRRTHGGIGNRHDSERRDQKRCHHQM